MFSCKCSHQPFLTQLVCAAAISPEACSDARAKTASSPLSGRSPAGEDPAVVCLASCTDESKVDRVLPEVLERCGMGQGLAGTRVLVKPNLLRNNPLACTSPAVVACLCAWLLDQGARVVVADSPGFGSAKGVARDIGLEAALARLGLQVEAMGKGVPVTLAQGSRIRLSRTALEADRIVSAARVKAHSQMRLTLSCKNLYGCVPGLFKALYHTREGEQPERFAAMQAAILQALPPVAAVLDGIVAMHRTGPSSGDPFPLGLVGASTSPVALDEAVCQVLGQTPQDVPLQRALILAGHPDCLANGKKHVYPMASPAALAVPDFQVPQHLLHTSFKPLRLVRSCLTRLWKEHFS